MHTYKMNCKEFTINFFFGQGILWYLKEYSIKKIPIVVKINYVTLKNFKGISC